MDPSKRLSKSDPEPASALARAGKRVSGFLRGRRVSCEPDVLEGMRQLSIVEDKGEVVSPVISPRISKTYGNSGTVHTDMILSLLDSTQAGAPFAKELFAKFSALITSDKKPLKNAACDLWRCMSKVQIIDRGDLVLEIHPKAYNDLEPEDKPDLNRRFLQILGRFPRARLPEAVEWKKIEDVAAWVERNLALDVADPVARFIRSWSQDRYTGLLVNEVVSGFGYDSDSDPPPPIIADLQNKRRVHTCTFLNDGSHRETLLLPIKIIDRETREQTLEWLDWTLEFRYSADCLLQEVTSSAKRRVKKF